MYYKQIFNQVLHPRAQQTMQDRSDGAVGIPKIPSQHPASPGHASSRTAAMSWAWSTLVGETGSLTGVGGCGSRPRGGFGMQLALRKFGHPDYKHACVWRWMARYLPLS